MQRPAARTRHVVARQLHDKGRGTTGEQTRLLEHDAGDDDRYNTEEVEERRDPRGLGVADERAHDERNHGQLGAARDERRGHDRHATVLLVLDRLGGEHAGHAAAGGHQHGDERLRREAETAEHASITNATRAM